MRPTNFPLFLSPELARYLFDRKPVRIKMPGEVAWRDGTIRISIGADGQSEMILSWRDQNPRRSGSGSFIPSGREVTVTQEIFSQIEAGFPGLSYRADLSKFRVLARAS